VRAFSTRPRLSAASRAAGLSVSLSHNRSNLAIGIELGPPAPITQKHKSRNERLLRASVRHRVIRQRAASPKDPADAAVPVRGS